MASYSHKQPNIMCIEKLNKIIEESGFGIIGLRVMTGGETVSVGENLGNSFVWDDGFCTDEQIVVIGGCDGYEGTDEHEVVIFNAKCIFIFK